jgi:replicative DNA helicase
LDYINLLTSSKGKDSYERVKYISEETRALTYAFKCPLITVTQLNRSGYSVNEPGLTSLSESYALGATADFIGSLWQGDGDNALGIMRTTMLKNRFGANTGTNAFKIDYSTLTISEDASLNNMTDATEDVARSLLMLSGS